MDRLTRLRVYNAVAPRTIPAGEVATSVPIPELPGESLHLQLSLTDDLSREWYYFGYDKYEVPVRHVLAAQLRALEPGKPWCLLDVGANMGYFSLFLAALAKAEHRGSVHAFEPSPAVYRILSRHVALNQGLPITLVPAAVSDVEAWQTLFLAHEQHGHSAASLVAGVVEQTSQVSVRTVTIDGYVQSIGQPPVGLLKMDCEGVEAKVLAGMSHILERDSPAIVLEALPRYETLVDELASLPFFSRYRKFQITETGLVEHDSIVPSYQHRDWLLTMRPPGA